MGINKKKYEQVIVYLCSKLGGEIRGKKKLAKLLYFADFDYFEKFQRPITGDVYRALPMGPFPSKLEDISSEMTKKKEIIIEKIEERDGYFPTEVYRCLVKPNISVLGSNEKKMLDRVVLKYGHLSGRQLEELSHAEAPYIGTEPKKEIPYELSFYRGTDFHNV